MTPGEIALLLRIQTNDRVGRCPFYGVLSISNDQRLRSACSGRRRESGRHRPRRIVAVSLDGNALRACQGAV